MFLRGNTALELASRKQGAGETMTPQGSSLSHLECGTCYRTTDLVSDKSVPLQKKKEGVKGICLD